MRHRSVASALGIGCVAERMLLWCWLRVPDVASVAAEVARLEGFRHVFLDHDGTSGRIDEPGAWNDISVTRMIRQATESTLLHLGDQFFIEHASSLFVQRAIDGDDVTLCQHLFQILHTSTSNLFFKFGFEGLVVEVEELFAIECLQSSQNTLSNSSDGNGADDFIFEIILAFGHCCDIPIATRDLFVSWDKVADKDEDGHDDVLGNGDDVGAGDFGNGDASIGLVGGVQVDMVGSNTGGDGEFEVFGLGEAFGGQVARVKAGGITKSTEARLSPNV